MSLPQKKQKLSVVELLVQRGLCASLKEAQSYVYAGSVFANEQRVDKPGQKFSSDVILRVKRKTYVSRGGEKLAKAIEFFSLETSFKDKLVLDVGASTGGFTDCVLKLGAKKVLALDIGFNQLDWSLRTDSRVVSIEKTDLREFDASTYDALDWIIGDVSFVSLETLAQYLIKLASPHTRFLLLIKPQFELSKNEVPEGGVVEDEKLWDKAIQNVLSKFQSLGAGHFQVTKSAVKGRSGNQEFFVYFGLASELGSK